VTVAAYPAPPAPDPFTVIGVVGDVRHTGLGPEPEAGIYHPVSQVAPFRGVLVARTSGDPRSLIRPMRTAIAELDPALPLFNTRTLGDLRDEALAAPRLMTGLTGLFAALALVLGIVGIYGIVAFSVSTRRRETGLRMALGARPADVVRLFLRRGLVLAATGLALGLAGAAAAGFALASAAPEIPPPDAATLAGIGVLLGLATLAACYLPVRAALRVDPTEIMRGE
jgi:ABC-type antimicrobial peptide transport system permease subunit